MIEQGRSFFGATQGAERILVLDLGFLGDTIHLIPALHEIRRAYPNARLDVMVAEHVKSILDLVPGVDGALGYPRFPHGPRWWQDFGRVKRIRVARFDAVINLNGSDRSSLLTGLSAAPWRLGRIPPKKRLGWRRLFSHAVAVAHGGRPVFQQRWECVREAGIPVGVGPQFAVRIPPAIARAVKTKLGDERDFVHVSPCTTQDQKELPMRELVALVRALIEDADGPAVVLSCAPNDRERGKLQALVEQMPVAPWRVLAGDLCLKELADVIGRAQVHFGGDSGALHLALMMNTPTVSWFRDYPGKVEWLPPGDGHRHVAGRASSAGLQGLQAGDLLAAWQDLRQANNRSC